MFPFRQKKSKNGIGDPPPLAPRLQNRQDLLYVPLKNRVWSIVLSSVSLLNWNLIHGVVWLLLAGLFVRICGFVPTCPPEEGFTHTHG